MYQDYRWVAMLDPVELADGLDRDDRRAVDALIVDDVAEVDHGGRPAWEAVVRTTHVLRAALRVLPAAADPRGRPARVRGLRREHVLSVYPDAFRVRLDVGHRRLRRHRGDRRAHAGPGHDLRIEAVDERMDDDLFAATARSFRRRCRRGAPVGIRRRSAAAHPARAQ